MCVSTGRMATSRGGADEEDLPEELPLTQGSAGASQPAVIDYGEDIFGGDLLQASPAELPISLEHVPEPKHGAPEKQASQSDNGSDQSEATDAEHPAMARLLDVQMAPRKASLVAGRGRRNPALLAAMQDAMSRTSRAPEPANLSKGLLQPGAAGSSRDLAVASAPLSSSAMKQMVLKTVASDVDLPRLVKRPRQVICPPSALLGPLLATERLGPASGALDLGTRAVGEEFLGDKVLPTMTKAVRARSLGVDELKLDAATLALASAVLVMDKGHREVFERAMASWKQRNARLLFYFDFSA